MKEFLQVNENVGRCIKGQALKEMLDLAHERCTVSREMAMSMGSIPRPSALHLAQQQIKVLGITLQLISLRDSLGTESPDLEIENETAKTDLKWLTKFVNAACHAEGNTA